MEIVTSSSYGEAGARVGRNRVGIAEGFGANVGSADGAMVGGSEPPPKFTNTSLNEV